MKQTISEAFTIFRNVFGCDIITTLKQSNKQESITWCKRTTSSGTKKGEDVILEDGTISALNVMGQFRNQLTKMFETSTRD